MIHAKRRPCTTANGHESLEVDVYIPVEDSESIGAGIVIDQAIHFIAAQKLYFSGVSFKQDGHETPYLSHVPTR